jgi:riboflavin synthase
VSDCVHRLSLDTLSRSRLMVGRIGRLNEGDYVNCERAMSGHTRFGGHMVQVSDPPEIAPVS